MAERRKSLRGNFEAEDMRAGDGDGDGTGFRERELVDAALAAED